MSSEKAPEVRDRTGTSNRVVVRGSSVMGITSPSGNSSWSLSSLTRTSSRRSESLVTWTGILADRDVSVMRTRPEGGRRPGPTQSSASKERGKPPSVVPYRDRAERQRLLAPVGQSGSQRAPTRRPGCGPPGSMRWATGRRRLVGAASPSRPSPAGTSAKIWSTGPRGRPPVAERLERSAAASGRWWPPAAGAAMPRFPRCILQLMASSATTGGPHHPVLPAVDEVSAGAGRRSWRRGHLASAPAPAAMRESASPDRSRRPASRA